MNKMNREPNTTEQRLSSRRKVVALGTAAAAGAAIGIANFASADAGGVPANTTTTTVNPIDQSSTSSPNTKPEDTPTTTTEATTATTVPVTVTTAPPNMPPMTVIVEHPTPTTLPPENSTETE